jgi:NO-binding membrane sensor protein with MHYT domain
MMPTHKGVAEFIVQAALDVKKQNNIRPVSTRDYRGNVVTKAVSLVLLVGGVLLIIFGFMAATSLTSDISRFFTGSPTDKSIWMLMGGVVASAVGVVGLLRG